ncbi:MAG: hypothetical protein SNJ74_09420 [Fimbriimonadaceae bacterium]
MPNAVFGRTNRAFPPVWLSLRPPRDPDPESIDRLAAVAVEAAGVGVPLDITSQPGIWGSHLRGRDATLVAVGRSDIESATEEAHAADLVQAHILEILCSLTRPTVDFYALRVRRAMEEFQVSGALMALESARQEGHIRHLALWVDGPPLAALGLWQFHDAFEVVFAPVSHRERSAETTLTPLARERRVGIVGTRPLEWAPGVSAAIVAEDPEFAASHPGWTPEIVSRALVAELAAHRPVLVGVHSDAEAKAALDAGAGPVPEDAPAILAAVESAWNDLSTWGRLSADARDWVRRTASRARPDVGRPR